MIRKQWHGGVGSAAIYMEFVLVTLTSVFLMGVMVGQNVGWLSGRP